ncbi:hypothetical protein CORC01_06607 [Colletotrichum orchidophilum]|uniref:Thioester reductase (TE) domain-containing protein n=1 Tax=Colletotrichum orchidophilum TaxID=1209926 RepID=A0A1G4B9L9_9PEZI|nr:uncharacterized protein CORC01_06607 [Colletotrichum orchidophilum]OHE98093.1 hypothetical protein CORC01_06607 [Colletotrichum orchidophilum]
MKESAQQATDFLPYYMVPSVYLLADRALLSASGKLERRSVQHWLEQISADNLEPNTLTALYTMRRLRIVYISRGPQWDPEELAESTILERDVLEDVLAQSNAYGQTKLITGAIIQRAAAGDPRLAAKFAVVRPALIIGSSVDGVPNLDDFVWRVVMGCHAIRAFPEQPR